MAGPDQSGLVVRLKQIAADHGVEERISWPGMLRDEMKWGAFYASDAFILPSHQENFGISVAEALGCGVPVLISDKVNIWREVMAHGAGLVAPDSLQGTTRLLRDYVALTPPQRVAVQPQPARPQRSSKAPTPELSQAIRMPPVCRRYTLGGGSLWRMKTLGTRECRRRRSNRGCGIVFLGSGSFQWGATTLTTGSIIMPMSTAV